MATKQEVKKYLAYWFQLGKKVVVGNGSTLLPERIIVGDRYSDEFEECWEKIISPEMGDCYLEGTHQTIAELLTPAWEMEICARCEMPIAMHSIGMPAVICPCYYLPEWPNTELPSPRCPVDTQEYLQQIRDRLFENGQIGKN
ncbi:MAG: hypothetical protein QNJ47_17680 [Nostocaceae cyanobacterium]|nr:hypothetical protein [Nostocaceae cyanobacterium]